MARRDDIVRFADELLDVESYPEYGRPGLQVTGADEVSKLVCGVSSSREMFERAGTRLLQAADEGYDALVTGEPEEPALHAARELGIHFLAGGHYATETFGVKALAARLADEFALEWEFLDLPNPV